MSRAVTSSPVQREATNPEQYQNFYRGRGIKSCLECRRRKMRCSRSQPCQNCSRFSRNCIYVSFLDLDSTSFVTGRDTSPHRTEDRDRLVRSVTPPETQPSIPYIQDPLAQNGFDAVPASGNNLNGRETFSMDDRASTTNLQVGKLRITDHIGDFSRDQLASRVRIWPLGSYST